MNIIGQEKLLAELNTYTLDTFPHTVLITGEKGSGKHLIAGKIAEILNLKANNMVEDVLDSYIYKCAKKDKLKTREQASKDLGSEFQDEIRSYIDRLQTDSKLGLYVLDFTSKYIGRRRTNVIQYSALKLAEEPHNNIYFIIIIDDVRMLLDTIYNRCRVFETQPYTREQLQNFTQNEQLLSILRTPGQIIDANSNVINDCIDTCNKIADKIETINLPNLLKVVDKINYGDNFDKFEVELFLDTLTIKLFEKYYNEHKANYLDYYLFVTKEKQKLRNNIQVLTIDRERFMEHFLVSFWEVAHGL